MQRPKIGKSYIFVRDSAAGIEWIDYIRHEDGSSGFFFQTYALVYDNNPDAWKTALRHLEEWGFVLLGEAERTGMVPADWVFTEANRVAELPPIAAEAKDQPTDPAS